MVSMKNTTQRTETLTVSEEFFFQNFHVAQGLGEAGSKITGNVKSEKEERVQLSIAEKKSKRREDL